MPWHGERHISAAWNQRHQRLVFLSMMVALAMVLQILESILPNPAPWIRLGLANVVILIVLSIYGIREGLMVTGLRVVLAAILLGTIFGPTFWLSLSGGIASTIVMGMALLLFPRTFSLIGVSVIGSYTHNLVQYAVASLFIIRQPELRYLLPVLLVTALVAGITTGVAACLILSMLERHSLRNFPFFMNTKNGNI